MTDPSKSNRRRAVALLTLLAGISGCSAYEYRHLSLGQRPAQYEKILPRDSTRSTPHGLVRVRESSLGRSDILVALLTPDRRIHCKLWLRMQRDSNSGLVRNYELEGSLDTRLADLAGVGPIDALRVVLAGIEELEEDQTSRLARDWMAAGIVRIIQTREPTVAASQSAAARILDEVPAGGRADIVRQSDGRLFFYYRR